MNIAFRALTLAGALAAVSLTAAPATAASNTVAANTEGWIDSAGTANNPGFGSGVITNHFAGVESNDFRDFFSFVVPTFTVNSAVLSIFNSGSNSTIDPTAAYNLYAPSSFSFPGFVSGASLGSVSLAAADTGVDHYVDITLNAAGLAYLNANLGGAINFSGAVTSTQNGSGCFDCVTIFGYTNGTPVAQLTLSSVPEPMTWSMMIAGFGLVGAALRRKRESTALTVSYC